MVSEMLTIMVAQARDGLETDKKVRIWAPGLDGAVITALDWTADSSILRAVVAHGDEGDHYFEAVRLHAVRVAEPDGA